MTTGPTRRPNSFIASAVAAILLAVGLGAGDTSAAPQAGDSNGATPTAASPQEYLVLSKEDVARMQDTLRTSVALQEGAKQQKAVIKLNCINDKVLQIRGHISVADQAVSSIVEATAKADLASAQHEYLRVRILQGKVLVLGTESQGCIGEDLSYVGATTVLVEIDKAIPTSDPTQWGFPVIPLDRPPVASPMLPVQ